MNKTLDTRRAGVINMDTNPMGVLSSDHVIRIVRIDLIGDDRCCAPTADPRCMAIVGA